LPPSEQEALRWTEQIENATQRQQAIEALIDSLLHSPHFGERFARHWMDWIRYAESHGSEGDPAIDNAWMYRDYLIRALNDDIPSDQLIREHLAGDLLTEPRVNESLGLNESVIGTAHLRMVFHGFAPTDALDEKVRFIDDQINVLSKAFLGLTVSCARCHDHKFDAISQADYYALFGILASCRPGRNVVDLPEIQNRNRSELNGLKRRIRDGLIDRWIKSTESAAERLVEVADKPQTELGKFFQRLQAQQDEGKSLAAAWTQLMKAEADRLEQFDRFAQSNHELTWDFADSADADTWYQSGIGVQHHGRAGTFAVSTGADRIIEGIYPAGVYTHAL